MRYRINAKFADEVLIPANAIEDAFYKRRPGEDIVLVTTDGFDVRPTFCRTSNNKKGMFDADLEEYCQSHFGMTFDYFRKIWFGRLGSVDNYWHFIKLEKI